MVFVAWKMRRFKVYEKREEKMKGSQSEDLGLAEAVEQFKYFMRKKYEMDKEKSSGGAVMKKYVSPCGMEMDEDIFAIMMERDPWLCKSVRDGDG